MCPAKTLPTPREPEGPSTRETNGPFFPTGDGALGETPPPPDRSSVTGARSRCRKPGEPARGRLGLPCPGSRGRPHHTTPGRRARKASLPKDGRCPRASAVPPFRPFPRVGFRFPAGGRRPRGFPNNAPRHHPVPPRHARHSRVERRFDTVRRTSTRPYRHANVFDASYALAPRQGYLACHTPQEEIQ